MFPTEQSEYEKNNKPCITKDSDKQEVVVLSTIFGVVDFGHNLRTLNHFYGLYDGIG